MTKILVFLLLGTVLGLTPLDKPHAIATEKKQVKPKISFTFDDGAINDIGTYTLETWNQLLLNNLKKHKLKVVLFSSGYNKSNQKGKYILSSWNNSRHLIANHTFSHPNINSDNITLENFKHELIGNDTLIKKYSNYYPYFRFPYLKETQ
jgi:peptidoglycan/xylan/chitin deacetylase (PgdA/CDA1 family)